MSFDTALSKTGWLSRTSSTVRRQPRRGLPKALMTILLLLSITSIVGAQDGAVQQLPTGIDNKATPKKEEPLNPKEDLNPQITMKDQSPASFTDPAKESEKQAEKKSDNSDPPTNTKEDEFLKSGKPRVVIDSISPSAGPTTGDTKVIVRGGPFAPFQQEHPEPKCKFGDQIVGGTYVNCPPRQPRVYEKEGTHVGRTALCVQCENSPAYAKGDTSNVTFAISFDGTFEDVKDSTEYWYYQPVTVTSIKPMHGPKDGGTTVQVWGQHF